MAEQPSFLELVMDRGPRPGLKLSLTKTSATIGRAADNDFVIDDPEISRHHARLVWDGRQVIIEDLGSANGTFVNGVRLTAPCILQPGDSLGLAQTVALRAMSPFMAAPGAPDATLPSGLRPPGAQVPPPPPVPRPAAVHGPTPPSPPKGPAWACILPAVLAIVCLLGAAIGGLAYYWQQRQNVSVPLVSIASPQRGARVEVGQPVRVDLVAYDSKNKITRLELWVDGHLHEMKSSDVPGGMSPLPLMVDWRPDSPGTHTLAARAYNRQGRRASTAVSVEATETPDRDRDGVKDPDDACPDEPGQPSANGCPDRDLDGIADNADACPDQAGVPELNGCPNPQTNDRDGDGVLDADDACPDANGSVRTRGCPDRDSDGVQDGQDACPDVWGPPENGGCPPPGDRDADGVPDASDACPDERGSPQAGGCPDRDADTVPDAADACPDDWGLPALSGCPDRDGDGLRDREDACPDAAGPPERFGCPDTGAGDRDRDGVPDDADLDPDRPGDPQNGGAPAPGEGEDADEDGVEDAEELPEDPLDPGDVINPEVVSVELQALEFYVDADYDEVYCYAGVSGEDMEQFGPFEPMGERRWNIVDFLGGQSSRVLTIPPDQPLALQVEGGGLRVFMDDPENPWATYYSLGQVIREHPPGDWDGHVITAESEGGDEGHGFRIQYRLCRDSCEGAAFQRPLAYILEAAGETWLCWEWEGNEADIDGFLVSFGGDVGLGPFIETFAVPEPGRRSLSLHSIESSWPCGNSFAFQVAAYREEGELRSPLSNEATWNSPDCPVTVQVTFDRITTDSDLEMTQPIYGSFYAVGSSGGKFLWFVTHDRRLAPSSTYRIMDIFARTNEDFERIGEDCRCYAPTTNSVIVGLERGDTLTFGGDILHVTDQRIEWLFDAHQPFAESTITSGEYSRQDRHITLWVSLNVIREQP